MHPIEKVIEDCDRVIFAEDFDTLMENYTENAILVVQPGINATGKSEIRHAFERIAVYLKHGLSVEQLKVQTPHWFLQKLLCRHQINRKKKEKQLTYSTKLVAAGCAA